VTGQKTEKHRLGGAYPGARRPLMAPYTPGASEFDSQGQATAHFVSYGGGNALVLQQNGIAQPQVGQPVGKKPTYIQVTLPTGVKGGDKIHVQAPDGRLNEIIVPTGFGPGSTFTVEFADALPPTGTASQHPPYDTLAASHNETPLAPAYNEGSRVSNNNSNYDDGFASGFNNPGFVPSAPGVVSTLNNDADLSSYPTALDAKPVYSTTPTYPSNV